MIKTNFNTPKIYPINGRFIARFLKLESASGIILMLAAVSALVLANRSLKPSYVLLIDTPVEIRIGAFEIAKPLLLWTDIAFTLGIMGNLVLRASLPKQK